MDEGQHIFIEVGTKEWYITILEWLQPATPYILGVILTWSVVWTLKMMIRAANVPDSKYFPDGKMHNLMQIVLALVFGFGFGYSAYDQIIGGTHALWAGTVVMILNQIAYLLLMGWLKTKTGKWQIWYEIIKVRHVHVDPDKDETDVGDAGELTRITDDITDRKKDDDA